MTVSGPSAAVLEEPRRIQVFALGPPCQVVGAVVRGVLVEMHDDRTVEWGRTVERFSDEPRDLIGLASQHEDEASILLVPDTEGRRSSVGSLTAIRHRAAIR